MTDVLNPMLQLAIHSSLAFLLGLSAIAAPEVRVAPNLTATPANQLRVAGNACGPAALLNAFRFGNEDWQRVSNAIVGDNDRERILRIIREIGMRPSKHVPGHPRWSRRGVSLADLRDMGDEMAAGQQFLKFSDEVFFLKPRESPEKLLQRVHQRLEKSLAKGFPPIISLRRYALRKPSTGGAPQWVVADAHFITLTTIPRKIDKLTRRIPVSYIDPWGGKRCEGSIGISERPVFANAAGQSLCLESNFPQTSVGKSRSDKKEKTFLAVAAAMGRW